MTYIYKILILIIFAGLGWLIYPVMVNLMLKTGLIGAEFTGEHLQEMTQYVIYAWLGATVLGVISIFIEAKWRYFLVSLPLVIPSLFAVTYALAQ